MTNKRILACSECGSRNYSTHGKEKSEERLEVKKFCRTCNSHTIHKQTK
ncbi:50S ribosomal protein L33 [Bacillus sp. B190/17]|uniref:Large ribosomal subunit protein bL33 n=1 Tax=Bacillus lumedeiriae TaxID=3058829 RepID=A0ABW8IBE8_9BACI